LEREQGGVDLMRVQLNLCIGKRTGNFINRIACPAQRELVRKIHRLIVG
jgi:hypothetical protein